MYYIYYWFLYINIYIPLYIYINMCVYIIEGLHICLFLPIDFLSRVIAPVYQKVFN